MMLTLKEIVAEAIDHSLAAGHRLHELEEEFAAQTADLRELIESDPTDWRDYV